MNIKCTNVYEILPHAHGESAGGLFCLHSRRYSLIQSRIQILLNDTLQFKIRVQFLQPNKKYKWIGSNR